MDYYAGTRSRLRQKPTHNNLQGGDEPDWEVEAELSEFSVYEFHQLLEATNNFSEENKLGEGGFGPVYKVVVICFQVFSKHIYTPIIIRTY